jgi:hypothetical protein
MAIGITDEVSDEPMPENFDTTAPLRAVDAVDEMRGDLNDGENGRPPHLRIDLLKLHQLAMAVIKRGARSQVAELFDLAIEMSGCRVSPRDTRWVHPAAAGTRAMATGFL